MGKLFPKIQQHHLVWVLIIVVCLFLFSLETANKSLTKEYQSLSSPSIVDRFNTPLVLIKNKNGYYAQYGRCPENIIKALIAKEDKYFYWHKGFNPISTLQDLLARFGLGERKGSSTITQQLAKILLSQENQRTAPNKFKELFFALALDLYNPKSEIAQMYCNSIYFGNQIQGVKTASQAYFAKTPDNLRDEEISLLLATISNPSIFNPLSGENAPAAKFWANKTSLAWETPPDLGQITANYKKFNANNLLPLELETYLREEKNSQQLTLDAEIDYKVRQIVSRNIIKLQTAKAKNAAAIVIKVPENEVLSMVGSPDQYSLQEGYQINILQKPRAIGSTVKPFIYLLAFEKGQRPYTLIEDREYKYITNDGLPYYPRNYDNKYHGLVTAHYALANSLNVPALKTLEFVGVDDFSNFLENKLEFPPVQSLENYQLGMAMGLLEMPLIKLAHYFTIFPNEGKFSQLRLFQSPKTNALYFSPMQKQVAEKKYVQLINKILSDRAIAQDQFGAQSLLNLQTKNYALKTGTSQDYKDSWIIGYTPNYLVGVWVGNADNSKTEGLSGAKGAAVIWNDIMDLLANSRYASNDNFQYSEIENFEINGEADFGLKGDNLESAKNIMLKLDSDLILTPHANDVYILEGNTVIKLTSKFPAQWKINDKFLGSGTNLEFYPKEKGRYDISASSSDLRETLEIYLR